ncbi:hypothetical protein PsYK624_140460 [Phanerochaete sordida]|uniref:Uncharacterized protein n=1 Tax=Phanerochaete sordida TaxID=48140 RepID=A0A9P3LKM1_9APHY|nr:hypothetical protein PsYK624_140460 [Phanerochaete sordida]
MPSHAHTSRTGPRPILKASRIKHLTLPPLPFAACTGNPLQSPHVHFPPTPCLVQSTHPAHSPRTYDRKPIVVSPNACDLPERAERRLPLRSPPADFELERPSRSRSRSRSPPDAGAREPVLGSYFHPRAFEACTTEPPAQDAAPAAVRFAAPPHPRVIALESESEDEGDSESEDTLSDDSDDSDAVLTPPDVQPSGALPDVPPSPAYAAGLQRDTLDGDKPRPHLVRANKQPEIIPLREYTITIVDEGCLGGF